MATTCEEKKMNSQKEFGLRQGKFFSCAQINVSKLWLN